MVENLTKADPGLGKRVAKGLNLVNGKIMRGEV